MGELGALGDVIFIRARRMGQNMRFDGFDSHLTIKNMHCVYCYLDDCVAIFGLLFGPLIFFCLLCGPLITHKVDRKKVHKSNDRALKTGLI